MHDAQRYHRLLAFALSTTLASLAAAGQPPGSDRRTDLIFDDPVSVREVYRSLGETFGVPMLFDPRLRDQRIEVHLEGVDLVTALDYLSRTAGHFYKTLDDGALLIAEDTPQNRRTYEEMQVRLFLLENAEIKDVMTVLRSLIGLKNVAPYGDHNGVLMRATTEKVAIAARLVEVLDREPGEVAVDVAVFEVEPGSLDGVEPTPELLERRVGDGTARRIARSTLHSVGGAAASVRLGKAPLAAEATAPAGEPASSRDRELRRSGLSVQVTPRLHRRSGAITLDVDLSLVRPVWDPPGTQLAGCDLSSSLRIPAGETRILTSLTRTDLDLAGGVKTRRDHEETTELVVALTPRVVHQPGFRPEDLLAIDVGTEATPTLGATRVASSGP